MNKTSLFLLTILFFFALPAFLPPLYSAESTDPVYTRVYEALLSSCNRLPGSEGYRKSLEAVEKELRDAGLTPHRISYPTLVPETVQSSFTYNGESFDVYPLAPNGVAMTEKTDMTAPVIYLGKGAYDDIEKEKLKDVIVLLDASSPNMKDLFSHGARAVILVVDGTEDIHDFAPHFSQAPVSVPRLCIRKSEAEKAGLLNASGEKEGHLQVFTRWKDEIATTLWVEIKGREDSRFFYGRPEALFFTTMLDTFGTVPDQTLDRRMAANNALMTSLAVSLAGKAVSPARSLYFVFFGSHYSFFEGARIFYFPFEKTDAEKDSVSFRIAMAEKELESIDRELEVLRRVDPFRISEPELREAVRSCVDRISRNLDGMVGNNNYLYQQIYVPYVAKQNNGEEDPVMKAELDRLKEEKALLNELRSQIFKKEIVNLEAFSKIVDADREQAELRKRQMETHLAMLRGMRELQENMGDQLSVGHFDFDFSSATLPFVAVPAKPEAYTRHMVAFTSSCSAVLPELDSEFSLPLVSEMKGGYNPAILSMPGTEPFAGMIAHDNGVFGYRLITAGGDLKHDDLPFDEKTVDLSPLKGNLERIFLALAENENLSLQLQPTGYSYARFINTRENNGKYSGLRFYNFQMGSSSELECLPKDALAVWLGEKNVPRTLRPGHSDQAFVRIDANGYIFLPGIRLTPLNMTSYGFDANGAINRVSVREGRLEYGFSAPLYFPFYPTGYDNNVKVNVLNAKTNSSFSSAFTEYDGSDVVFFCNRLANLKIFGGGYTLIGATREHPEGDGLPLGRELFSENLMLRNAEDQIILNESRLNIFRRKNIVNESLETLHADAEDHYSKALEAEKEQDYRETAAHSLFSSVLAEKVIVPLRAQANDMIQAVVLLLILSIPFAFCLERLIFGFTDIYRQVFGFLGIFLLTFGLLYVVHPAFSMAAAPIIIFLAFMILLLSVIVIYVVMEQFKYQIQALQGLASKAHGVQTGSGTTMASVLIGISGMRNRPLKTALTVITVVLLTFTILVFSSFTSKLGVTDVYLGKGDGPDRIELNRFTLTTIPGALVESIKTLYGGEFSIFERKAHFKPRETALKSPVWMAYNPANHYTFPMPSMIGFDPGEIRANPALSRFLEKLCSTPRPDGLLPVLLPPMAEQALELKIGDPVLICGEKFFYAGTFDPMLLGDYRNTGGTKLLPLDLAEEDNQGKMEMPDLEENVSVDMVDLSYFSANQVAVTVNEAFRTLPGFTNFVIMYANAPETDIRAASTAIAPIFTGQLCSVNAGTATRHFFTKQLEASGFTEVFVPLLLGGLIIFSSLLGSTVERAREIFTYSALGLAPLDVGSLFFAEATVYAVIGGLGGYLLSQLVAYLLTLAASFGLLHPPEMNFSSSTTVYTILIVMATVILSALYPAYKAGKSANPGVARKWKMPVPENGVLKFIFPFTVSPGDINGILAFLKEYFDCHSDASMGNFASTSAEIFRMEEKGAAKYGIVSHMSLAPFDLGVFQEFKMFSRESDIPGIDELVVEIRRLNGTQAAWLRGNEMFVEEMRKQFLLWRALPLETVLHYKSFSLDGLHPSTNQERA